MTEWFSINEFLPPDDTEVLVYIPEYDCKIGVATYDRDLINEYNDGWHVDSACGKTGDPTHWRQLPNPPIILGQE